MPERQNIHPIYRQIFSVKIAVQHHTTKLFNF